MVLNHIVWDVDPYIFHIGSRPIAWYGLLWAMVFIVGYYIMQRIYKREKLGEEQLDKLLMYMLIFTIVGARLGHCLFYEPAYYFSNPIKFPLRMGRRTRKSWRRNRNSYRTLHLCKKNRQAIPLDFRQNSCSCSYRRSFHHNGKSHELRNLRTAYGSSMGI